MSNKLVPGIITGVLTGLSIAAILMLRKEEGKYSDQEEVVEAGDPDNAGRYLLLARKEVDKMIAEAAVKSDSILEEAGKILSSAKEKTSQLHYEHMETAKEEIIRIKKEIEDVIEDFNNRLNAENGTNRSEKSD